MNFKKNKMLGKIPEQTDGIAPQRSTGIFDFALKKANLLDLLSWAIENGKIPLDRKEVLTNMINSDDRENFVVAEEIIKTKQSWNSSSPQKTISMKP